MQNSFLFLLSSPFSANKFTPIWVSWDLVFFCSSSPFPSPPITPSILPPRSWLCPQCRTSFIICGAKWKQKFKSPNKKKSKNVKLVIAEALNQMQGPSEGSVWLRGLLAREAGPASRFWALFLLYPWEEPVGSSHASGSLRPTQVGDNSLMLATSLPVTHLQ